MPFRSDLVPIHPRHPPSPIPHRWYPDRSGLPRLQRHVLHTVLQDPRTQTTGTMMMWWWFIAQCVTFSSVSVLLIIRYLLLFVCVGCIYGLADGLRQRRSDPGPSVCLSCLHHLGSSLGLQSDLRYRPGGHPAPRSYVQTTYSFLCALRKDTGVTMSEDIIRLFTNYRLRVVEEG